MTADKIFKVLGNKIRLRLLCLLRERDFRVGDLQAITGLPMAMVSKDLMRLRAQKLVAATRRGVSITYTLANSPEAEALLAILHASQSVFPQEVINDAAALKSHVPSEIPPTGAAEKQFTGNASREVKHAEKTKKRVPAESNPEPETFGSLPTNLL